ncbi:hypothetical protein IFM89_012949 [Coptis chinensis]|uniref:4-coumarate--CoA ligase n=1 Tax=Coptis chinensis TaxID=261450 RepID=A0A835IWP3_9MAGN|nr:hypothetical protein IFM89_012949 [Coptis chinensis]
MITIASPETKPPQINPQVSTSETENTCPETFVFRSKLPDIPISNHLPLHTYCFERLSEFSDRPCLISGSDGRIYTYAETHLICQRTAVGLSSLGIKKGDVIMILLQNCPEFVFSFMGASMLGAITTTANPFYTSAEIFKQVSASGAKLIITQSLYVDKLQHSNGICCEDFKVVTINDPQKNCIHFSEISNADELKIEPVSIDPNDAVALPYSSGTTGLPKGVMLTHKSLISSVAQQIDGENPNLYLTADDTVLCVLPLFHIYSLNSVLLCSLRRGAGVLLMQKFEIKTLLNLIQKHRVSVAAVVPPLVLALAKDPTVDKFDLSSIRIVLSGAAPLSKELEEALRSRVPQAIFGQGYGMTEAGPVLSMCSGFAKQPFPTKSGSCGTVVRNAELKIIDPESGLSLRRNQPGEICIRGPQIMKGVVANEVNKVKVYGKDFISTRRRNTEFGIGCLENSFLVGGSGVEVVKNFSDGIQGKGVYVKFDNGSSKFGSHFGHSVSTPKKTLLMRAKINTLRMNSTTNEVSSHSTGLHQLDIEMRRIVLEWKFEKEGTDITMSDITNNSKGSQLDPSASIFLGLDDNRICRWDKRDRKDMIQNLASESTSVLNLTQGHQFSRGTNFQCFSIIGGGSIVVGSLDGYLNDADATASTIDLDGWLHTGDIGYVDDDDEVFIVDRVKELIKFKGFQVPPAELEALLVSHPSIADAAVVPQMDAVAGEVPVAFVVRSNDFELTEEAVKEFIAKQVVFYKRLHKVYFIHAIPKSPSGKILRKDLRAKLASSS